MSTTLTSLLEGMSDGEALGIVKVRAGRFVLQGGHITEKRLSVNDEVCYDTGKQAVALVVLSGLQRVSERSRQKRANGLSETVPVAPYGFCPICGAKGVSRERRPDGNDRCSNGHTYPARNSVPVLVQESSRHD